MKKLFLTLSLLLSMGLSVSAVAAQTPGVEAPDFDDVEIGADIEGLQSIYDRTFSVDFEAMMASPDADFENLDMSIMMRMISIQGMTFDSDDNAQAYLDMMRDEIEAETADPEDMGEIEVSDLEGFDVDGLVVSMDMADLEVGASVYVFVDGSHVFQVMVMDSDLEATDSLASDVTQFVLDADVENDEVSFNMDGTSTGGVFDRMPSADDEIVGDLTGVMDTEIIVNNE